MEALKTQSITEFRTAIREKMWAESTARACELGAVVAAGDRNQLPSDVVTASQICDETGWSRSFVEGLFITGILPGFKLFGVRVAKKRHWKHVYYELRRLRSEGSDA